MLRTSNHVALVVGSGGSDEEIKLGEALGLAYLMTALKQSASNTAVTLFNAIIDDQPRALRQNHPGSFMDAQWVAGQVAQINPVLCGISMVYRTQKSWTRRFMQHLRKLGCTSHIIIGGMYPTSAWESLLAEMPEVDSICIGEGDQLITQLLARLQAGESYQHLAGLAWRDDAGQPHKSVVSEVRIRDTGLRIGTAQLNRSITPDRGQLPKVIELGGVIQVECSRGCDAGCVFCDVRQTKWRPRPVSQLVDELSELAQMYPGALIYMIDNIFLGFSNDGSHLRRGQELARAIIDRGINIRFVIQDRAANIDRATFKLLKQAGLCEVYVGIESFSDSQLKRLRKGNDATPQANVKAIQTLDELGIYTQFGFLPFDDGVTWSELYQTISGLQRATRGRSYVHISNFNELIPYEGTHLAKRYQEEHGEAPAELDPWHYTDQRIKRLRSWAWAYSTALWPVTGLVFNKIQDPEFQANLHQTLPLKNRCFVDFLVSSYRLIEHGADRDFMTRCLERAVTSAVDSLTASLNLWSEGEAKQAMLAALQAVDTSEALLFNPDPGI